MLYEGVDLDERARIEKELDTFPGSQLASGVLAFDAVRSTA